VQMAGKASASSSEVSGVTDKQAQNRNYNRDKSSGRHNDRAR
jgi:hypothetical protein